MLCTFQFTLGIFFYLSENIYFQLLATLFGYFCDVNLLPGFASKMCNSVFGRFLSVHFIDVFGFGRD
jgi:hypothetical protein